MRFGSTGDWQGVWSVAGQVSHDAPETQGPCLFFKVEPNRVDAAVRIGG